MSSKFLNSRRSLAAALDQAADELPNLSSSSPNCSPARTPQDGTNEDIRRCTEPQDVRGLLDAQTSEDLVAKLEFENELNRVYGSFPRSKNRDHGKRGVRVTGMRRNVPSS